jgi:hypothetical protein
MPNPIKRPRDPDLQAFTRALLQLDDFPALGRTSLANSELVRQALKERRLPNSTFQRGRVLSQMIQREIQDGFTNRRQSNAARDLPEWTILYLHLLEGHTLDTVSSMLKMPRRSVDRYYRRAKQHLLDELLSKDPISSMFTVFCPLCGTGIAPLGNEPRTVTRCSRCDAYLTMTLFSNGTLSISAQPANANAAD